MAYEDPHKRAKRIAIYAIEQASTLADAINAFNTIASQIKTRTYEELVVIIDQELAW